jgi:hypothetical protein
MVLNWSSASWAGIAVWLALVAGWLVAEQPAVTSTNAQTTADANESRIFNPHPLSTL